MRRRLKQFLPVVMIALIVQIFAPIAACWAAAVAASDPLGTVAICHDTGGTADQNGDQGVPGHEHSGCSICCLAGVSAGLDTPKLTALANPHRDVARVVWRDHGTDAPASRTGSNAQARAPPFLS